MKKPILSNEDVLKFAETPSEAAQADKTKKAGSRQGNTAKITPDKPPVTSGNVPAGDVRLSANIDQGLHLKLKIAAARQRTTIGELLEHLIDEHLD